MGRNSGAETLAVLGRLRRGAALLTLMRGCILVCMRTTLILRDDLVSKAMALSNIQEKTALLHAGLEALIEREAARRLAKLGGTDPRAKAGPRRRAPRS